MFFIFWLCYLSLLIFSKLFTRRRLQREQHARQDPYLSVAREARLAPCPRKASATSVIYKYQQYRLTDNHANKNWHIDK
ncbi:MAG: hypothetical protein H0Z31_10840 [Bacillus sp. (in: Bacteria)]|nr:hypothetical protein [Bacillus sp. (in: firmicutes)]